MEFHTAGRVTDTNVLEPLILEIETFLGEPHDGNISTPNEFVAIWRDLIGSEFSRCLQCVEGLYSGMEVYGEPATRKVNKTVTETLQESELDLGISWHNGFFSKKGVELLDEKVVNESLRWLANPKYQNVLVPFQKGLSHLLEGTKHPQRFGDAVTDMYESLEAMAKIVTGKPSKDLSASYEEFIAKLRLSASHKTMLKEYID